MNIILDWSDFKAYLANNLVKFKQVTRNNTYYLYMSDGALTAQCTIPKNNESDQQDYEATYQSRANKEFASYSVAINIRQTASTAANATVFAMRNDAASTRKIKIEDIILNMSFDSGTPLGRSLQRYNLVGFNGATPTGGNQIIIASLDNTNPTSQVTDARSVDTGLTMAGVSFGPAIVTVGCPATDATVSQIRISDKRIVLAAGEGLAIRLASSAVAGQGLTGTIVWSER